MSENIEKINKDLGVSTAYAYAVEGGYTGTAEEFAELMASYATVAEEAGTARDEAVSAKDTAVNAVDGFEDTVTTETGTAVQTIQNAGATQVTAVQDKGNEVIASIPADYTSLEQDVTDLKSDLYHAISIDGIWQQGGISSANGANTTGSTRIRTASYLPKTADTISVISGYKYLLFAWDKGDYVGVWNGSSFVKSSVSWLTNAINLSEMPDYDYRIVLATSSDANIATSDGTNFVLYSTVDTSLSIEGVPADAKATGEKIDAYSNVAFTISNKRVTIDGAISASSGDIVTDFYPCNEGMKVQWHGRLFFNNGNPTMWAIAFYDSDKQFISGIAKPDGYASENVVCTITAIAPSNTAYIVGSHHDVSLSDPSLKVFDVLEYVRELPELFDSNSKKLYAYYSAPFNKTGYRYDYNTKSLVGYANGQVTDYVPCSAGDKVEFSGWSFFYNNNPYMYCIAFLADDYSFISGVTQIDGNSSTVSSEGTITATAPKGTAYVIGSNNATSNEPYLHVYSYEQILSRDDTKREDRKAIVQKIKTARHIKGNYDQRITLLHFSDLHHDSGAYERILADRVFYGNYIDDVICTGDFCEDQNEDIAEWWDASVMLCIGNHDVAKYEGGSYDWAYLSMADRTSAYIAPYADGWGVTHDSGKSYFYKDYANANLRMIVLDTMLYNLSGSEASEQETWLTNLLADAITNSLHVLIACHSPHGGAIAKECSFSRYNQDEMPTYSDCNTPQAIIDIVSTKISAGLHFCGYLVGHTHQDNIWDAEGDGKQLMYCVTTSRVNNKEYWKGSDQHRDATFDAYNIVTIDTRNTLVKIIRGGGANMDDHMRTRKAICFNYSTGEMVGEVL